MAEERDSVIVVGAGMGGLSAAADLARRGAKVTLLERMAYPGGKLRQVEARGLGVDAGPTVFTMRWIFEGLFEDCGQRLSDALSLEPMSLLARHAWRAGGRLDLFAEEDRSAEAIAAFAGAKEAAGYRAFCARAREVYLTLRDSYIAAQRPSPLDLTLRVGAHRLGALWRLRPFDRLMPALGAYFEDPRLRQLFGRYATYCGSSPYLAPATLMLVAHVEQDWVWRVEGGIRKVAEALAALAVSQGAELRYGASVERLLVEGGRVTGVELAGGERLIAGSVVFNGDVSALGQGLLGEELRRAAPVTPPPARSLSAVTWCLNTKTRGFPLAHHNVFFAEDYEREFAEIFQRRGITDAPTVYLCAQDRGEGLADPGDAPERLLLLINAPADGDSAPMDEALMAELWGRTERLLSRCGLELEGGPESGVATGPAGFDALFPGTGGAFYGRANHGAFGSFQRLGAASRLPGLYLAGGSVHPGPGIPMAAMSGRLAAARIFEGA
jgi:1-hydroxycarotenoid 3,4-desaturase